MSQHGPNLVETSKGYAVARFCGRTIHFGRFTDTEARVRFAAFKAAWEACGRKLPPSVPGARGGAADELTVAQFVDRYLEELQRRHPQRWLDNNLPRQRLALDVVRGLYGPEPAAQFSPKRLQVVRSAMIDGGRLCRREVNDRVRIVREAIEVWGRGTNRVIEACRAYGIADPTFVEASGAVTVTFQAEVVAGARGLVPGGHQVSTKSAPSRQQVQVLELAGVPRALAELMGPSGRTDRTKFRDLVLRPLLEAGLLEMTIPDKPRSSKQQYRITEAGRQRLRGDS